MFNLVTSNVGQHHDEFISLCSEALICWIRISFTEILRELSMKPQDYFSNILRERKHTNADCFQLCHVGELAGDGPVVS